MTNVVQMFRNTAFIQLNPNRKSIPASCYDRTTGRLFEMAFPRFASPQDIKTFRAAVLEHGAEHWTPRQTLAVITLLEMIEDQLFPKDILDL